MCGPVKVNGEKIGPEFKDVLTKYAGKGGKVISRFNSAIPKEDQHYMKTEISPQSVRCKPSLPATCKLGFLHAVC